MAGLSFKIQGLNEAKSAINNTLNKHKKAIISELDRTTLAIESGAKRNLTANGSVDTGRLRSSVVRQDVGEFKKSVGTNVEYAAGVEFGTVAHVIRPKRAKALKTPFGFFKKVNHPGSKAKPFLFPAAEAERSRFVANMSVILSNP